MLLGLRFLFGAALACLLVAGLVFALIAGSQFSHNTQASLIAPVAPTASEFVGPERRQTSGTGGPYVAPVIVPIPADSAPAPASLIPDEKPAANPKKDEPEATASIPAAPAATEEESKPAAAPTQDEKSRVQEAKREEPDKKVTIKNTIPTPLDRPVKKPEPRPRIIKRARIPEPESNEPPFNYFRN